MDRGSNLVCTVACSHISPCDWQGHTMQTSSFGGERSFMAKTVPDLRDVGAPAFLILNQERASSNLETRPPRKKKTNIADAFVTSLLGKLNTLQILKIFYFEMGIFKSKISVVSIRKL